MKLTKILSLVLISALVACNKPAGELVGSSKSADFNEANPYGMVFIKQGSFMMGPNTQSAISGQQDNSMMTTVDAFWMDNTEITNSEYRQFVDWVRDSIARTLLAQSEDYAEEFNLAEEDDEEEQSGNKVIRLNWKKKIPWNAKGDDAEEIREVLSPLFYSDGTLNTNRLHYRYEWVNYDEAVKPQNRFNVSTSRYPVGASVRVDTFWVDEFGGILDTTIVRPLREPKDLITKKIICIYPDTLVWKRDFQYAYNDPMLQRYFSHPGYADYPVVGVTWEQAHAFCNWRTKLYISTTGNRAQEYRLPSEAQWEYAARGGRKLAAYPWGNNYARDAKGCFLANFKPYRGAYNEDTGTTVMKVGQFPANDFGLFDMAGNVAEWTNSAFQPAANVYVHDLNPDYSYMARKDDPDILKRKVVKGGSWKDISYYLQCGVRTYEYQYESRPYIGFRCVRAYIGK